MDGLDAVFILLVLSFILILGYVYSTVFPITEGFTDSSSSSPTPVSDVELRIRSALDPYLNDDLCTIYSEMRKVLGQSIQGNSSPPTPATIKKVDATLTTEITQPPLPCPAFTYPTGHSEVEWINFLNGIPVTIGGTFVLMAIYAQRELAYRVNTIKTALDGGIPIAEANKDDAEKQRILNKTILSSMPTEGFTSIIGLCPMTTQAAAAAAAGSSPCTMPTELTHDEIVQSTTNILAKIDEQKTSILSAMYISPTIDVKPFLADALKNVLYLKSLISKASDGTLVDHLLNTASGSSSPMAV
jgi:hypothetical protein